MVPPFNLLTVKEGVYYERDFAPNFEKHNHFFLRKARTNFCSFSQSDLLFHLRKEYVLRQKTREIFKNFDINL